MPDISDGRPSVQTKSWGFGVYLVKEADVAFSECVYGELEVDDCDQEQRKDDNLNTGAHAKNVASLLACKGNQIRQRSRCHAPGCERPSCQQNV